MTRKLLLLPAIAAALLSGCVTYAYRDGQGDYYYGQPTTEYYAPYGYGGYGGYPGYYGGSSYWSAGFGYYGGYGPIRPPRHNGGGHGNGHGHGNDDHGGGSDGGSSGNDHPAPRNPPDRPRPPWRDLGGLDEPGNAGHPEQRRRAKPMPNQAIEPVLPVRMPARRVGKAEGSAIPVWRPNVKKRDADSTSDP